MCAYCLTQKLLIKQGYRPWLGPVNIANSLDIIL